MLYPVTFILGVAASLLFVPIEPLPAREAPLRNGCLVASANFEAALTLKNHGVWVRIVRLSATNQSDGHAVVVFSLRNGNLWVYDANKGSRSLYSRDRTIEGVTKALRLFYPTINKAEFLD